MKKKNLLGIMTIIVLTVVLIGYGYYNGYLIEYIEINLINKMISKCNQLINRLHLFLHA
ncbi:MULTISPECIES: hypothetical protein [Terrabacteria group]|uniref:hypothetical protein n=1 Tax=Bacillati TaxID=1783272 RepID=UPI001C6DE562|nr:MULTISPECIES: hypothetical protein [Terrabacteria group]MBW9212671.1 hypothetical protein [Trueperella sp. zg.1013]